jgi:hypothetical protein
MSPRQPPKDYLLTRHSIDTTRRAADLSKHYLSRIFDLPDLVEVNNVCTLRRVSIRIELAAHEFNLFYFGISFVSTSGTCELVLLYAQFF